jgi:transposase
VLHHTRHLFIRQQTSVINAIRAHCAEFGIVAPVGRRGVEELLNVIANAKDEQVLAIARACLFALDVQLRRIKEQILEFDRMITAWHRCCQTSRRLDEIPGVGPALATPPCRQRCQPEGIPIGARLLGLDRASAQAELEHRQAKARRHQAIRSLTSPAVLCSLRS